MKNELKWGIVIGVVVLLWHILERITGFDTLFLEQQKMITILSLFPILLIYALGLLQIKRDDYDNHFALGDGISSALRIFVFSIPFVLLAAFIKVQFINPDFLEVMGEHALTLGTAESRIEWSYSKLGYAVNSLLLTASGLIAGFIISFFIKTK